MKKETKPVKEKTYEEEVLSEELIDAVPASDNDIFTNERTPLTAKQLYENVEEKRLVLHKTNKTLKLVNRILFGVVLGVIIATFVIAMFLPQWIDGGDPDGVTKWVMYIPLATSVLMLLIIGLYVFLSKKSLTKKQNTYINYLLNDYGRFLYWDGDFKGFSINLLDRVTLEKFESAGVYLNVNKVMSRANYVIQYKNLEYRVAEMRAEIPSELQKKKTVTVFIGRFFETKNNLNLVQPVYFYIKGNGEMVSYPSQVDTMRAIKTENKYDIIGTNEDFKHIDKKVIDQIRRIEVDDVLLDMTIAFHPGVTYVTASYSDRCVDFPYAEEFDDLYIKRYKKDDELLAKVFELTNK